MPKANMIKKRSPTLIPKLVRIFNEIEKGMRNITSKSKIINKIATR